MLKRGIYFLFLFVWQLNAQQTNMYTQYTFNKAGLNPAASGTEVNQVYFYAIGLNRQWVGFDYAPLQNFFNFSYTLRPPRSYKHWQNFGFYVDNDQGGMIVNTSAYLSYTYHLLLRKTTILSYGVYAGIRQFSKSTGAFDANDPAVQKNKSDLFLYPDIIPGFRLTSKKIFMGVALKQITITRLKDFKGREIGSPSKLQPTIFFDYGHKISLSDHLLFMPSIAVNMPLIGPPNIDANVMYYYNNRVGAGVGLRNLSFASAAFQIRFWENLSAGFAYSYPINKMRLSNQNSFEIIIGIVPNGMEAKTTGRNTVAKCPSLSY